MNVNKRQRRTAAEARQLLLDTAERRLAEHGLDGLNVAGVAKEAGMSHATLLHHFGSSRGMRQALVRRMGDRLLGEAMAALERDQEVDRVIDELFSVFSTGGHAKLLAWRAVEDEDWPDNSPERRDQFEALIRATAASNGDGDVETARNLLLLVIAAAIGLGVGGAPLMQLMGMDEKRRAAFPEWLSAWIDRQAP